MPGLEAVPLDQQGKCRRARGTLSLLFDPPDWAKSNLPLLFEVRNQGMGPINKRNKRNERFKIKKIFVKI